MKVISMVCTKNFYSGQMGHFCPGNGAHPHNSTSTLRFFKNFCRIKGADRYMKILQVAFREKKSFGAI